MITEKQILNRVIRLEWEFDTLRCALLREIDAINISDAINDTRVDIEDLKTSVTRDLREIEKALDALPQARHVEQLESRLSERVAGLQTDMNSLIRDVDLTLAEMKSLRQTLQAIDALLRRIGWSLVVLLGALTLIAAGAMTGWL